MLKEEFETMINRQVSVDQSNLLNHVYMYHPAELSKQSIIILWCLGGFGIFKELTSAADHMCELEIHINTLKRQLKDAETELKSIKARYKGDETA